MLACLLACLLTYLLTYFLSYLLTDATASIVLKMIIKKNHLERHVKLLNEPKYLIKIDNHEYWWSMTFKTATRIPHNIPDLLVWDTDQKIWLVIEFSCTCDVNLIGKASEKFNPYGPLIRILQISYPQYRFEMIPIIIGALWYVAKNLIMEVKRKMPFMLLVNCIYVTRKSLATSRTFNICKTFLKFNDQTYLCGVA